MEIFKKSTGFLLFFIAAKLTLAALPKDRLLNVLTYGIIFSFCVWMWGKWVGFSTPAGKKWTVRLIALAIAVGTGSWLLPAPGLAAEVKPNWRDYDAALVQQATAQNRPVVLKFTADWCTNCKVVEKRVYHDAEVVELINARDVLPIKADTTVHDYPATIALKEVYGEAGNVPVTIVIRPDGTREKLRGIFDKQELIEILESLPEGQG
jgi:thiol:disulfide interchange protein DsbD